MSHPHQIPAIVLAAALWLTLAMPSAAAEPEGIPTRGAASTNWASSWEWAFVTGNGRMGAMVFGHPMNETIFGNHARLFLPLGSREIVPDLGAHLPEARRIIRDKGYNAAFQFMENKAREQGWNGLVWTDRFHPGFELKIRMNQASGVLDRITDYLRTEDFQTGEVAVRWSDADGPWQRRLFVSRPDNLLVLSITGPGNGRVNHELAMPPIPHQLIRSEQHTDAGWITAHNTYVKGKGGYDSVLRVVNRGGHITSDGQKVVVTEVDEVLVLGRIEPWKTPLPTVKPGPILQRTRSLRAA